MTTGWNNTTFGQFASLHRGYDLPRSQRTEGDVPVIGANGVVGYHGEAKFSTPGVMVGRSGSAGKSYYVNGPHWPLNTTLYVEDFHGNNPRFVEFFCQNFDFTKYAAGVSVPTLNRNVVHKARISLPPLPEQKKIAAVLLKIQRAIETQDKIIQSLRDLKKSTMQHLFTHGLRDEKTKITEIGEIPESWDVVPLSSFCSFLSGGTPRKSRADFWHGNIPWASPKDMKRPRLRDAIDHISEEGLAVGSCLAPQHAILVVVRGMILAKDVPVALIETPMAFNQDTKAMISDGSCNPEYLLYALQAFKRLLLRKVGRSAHGTRTLISETLAAFSIPLASDGEQAQIAATLHQLEQKECVHKSKKATLQALFKTTLNKLMTGDIRVADLDIDVKEVEA